MPDIKALTGLRFWAAFSIVLHHLLLGIVPRGTQFESMLMACGVLGMTAFFVLSGFIIHYNYHSRISDFSVRSYWEFFAARVSRLYPLYIILLAIDIALSKTGFGLSSQLKAMPYFLSLSQSWFFVSGPGGGLLPFVYPRASIAWSVSTEMFMYCTYPLILAGLLCDRAGSIMRVLWTVGAIVAISTGLSYLNAHPALIDSVAYSLLGQRANPIGPYTFAAWFTFYSPYLRLFEFLIGALACHLFLKRREVPVSALERRLASGLAALGIALILNTFLSPASRVQPLRQIFEAVGYYPCIAAIMYACARLPGSWANRFFSISAFVVLGEWSYSIYLFHIYIYHAVIPQPPDFPMILARVFGIIAALFVCAYVLYTFVEMPCRKRLRSWLMRWPVGLSKANSGELR